MLNAGWYCLMKFASSSSASVSLLTAIVSMRSVSSGSVRPPRRTGFTKWLAIRFFSDLALPT